MLSSTVCSPFVAVQDLSVLLPGALMGMQRGDPLNVGNMSDE